MLRYPEAFYETTAHDLGESFYDRVEGLVVKTLPPLVEKTAKSHDLSPDTIWGILLGPQKWTSSVANGKLAALAADIFTEAPGRTYLNVPRRPGADGKLPDGTAGALRDIGNWVRTKLKDAVLKVFSQELGFAAKDLQQKFKAEGDPISLREAEEIVTGRFIHHVLKSPHWWKQPSLLNRLQENLLR